MSGSIGVHAKTNVSATDAPAPPTPAPITPAILPAASADPAPVSRTLPDTVLRFVDAHRRVFLVGVLALYFLGFNGQWRLEPDSALYLTIGRNLAEGRGYTYH